LKVKNLIISICTSLLLFLILQSNFLEISENKYQDLFQGSHSALEDIVIIGIDDASIQEIGRWPWSRDKFSEIIYRLEESRVVGLDVGFFEEGEGDIILNESLNKKIVLASEFISFENGKGKDILKPIYDVDSGYVNLIQSSDGVVRGFNPHISKKESPFSVKIYEKYLGKKFNSEDLFYINYVSPDFNFKTYSFKDVYNGNYELDEFKDKIVLIGATSQNLHDTFVTPTSLSKNMPGVEVHANIIQNIILRNNLIKQSKFSLFLIILIFTLVAYYVLSKVNVLKGLVYLITGYILYIILSYLIYLIFNYQINVTGPFIVIFVISILNISLNYMEEQGNKKMILNTFGKYLSPVVVKDLIDNPHKVKLGGEEKEITILFSDIADFTSISEQFTPSELVERLNKYLNEMTSIILKKEGVVDKYIGDAIMAFWGAPLELKNKEELCCETALDMLSKRKKLGEELGIKNFNFRIGINLCDAIVGNMGSEERFDYTAIGDGINVAARLEGLNKFYGTNIMVSEFVYSKVKKKFLFRELDLVKVKGKEKPVKIYELISEFKEKNENILNYEKGLEFYKKGKFLEARTYFSKNKDKASKLFIERCEELKDKEIKNWDGVYEFKVK